MKTMPPARMTENLSVGRQVWPRRGLGGISVFLGIPVNIMSQVVTVWSFDVISEVILFWTPNIAYMSHYSGELVEPLMDGLPDFGSNKTS